MEIGLALVFILALILVIRKNRKFTKPIAAVYCLAVFYLAFIGREPTPTYRYSLRFFNAVSRIFEFDGGFFTGLCSGNVKMVSWKSLEGILLNILLFIPFGVFIPALCKKQHAWYKVLLLGLAGSICIEAAQYVTRLGFADVDDLMNNTIGAGLGYLLYKRYLAHVLNQN